MAETSERKINKLEETFARLSKEEQEHSIRVSEFAQAIFLQAVSDDIYLEDPKALVRLKSEYLPVISLGARLHDIGKAVEEDKENPTNGKLHPEKGAKLLEEICGELKQFKRLELTFMEEMAEYHEELFDGSGYPKGLRGREIPILGRIICVANALDRQASVLRSENSIDDALEILKKGTGTLYDPVIMEQTVKAKAKLKRIFQNHIAETRGVPPVSRMIRRNGSRPAYLLYRQCPAKEDGSPEDIEASMRFKITGRETYTEAAELIRKQKMELDLGIYFILEAADTVRRLDNAGIPFGRMILEVPAGFFTKGGVIKEIQSALADQNMEPGRIVLRPQPEDLRKNLKSFGEAIRKCREAGICVDTGEPAEENLLIENTESGTGTWISEDELVRSGLALQQ